MQLTSVQTARLDSISRLPKSECPACGNHAMIQSSKLPHHNICVICEHKIEVRSPSPYSHLIRLRRFRDQTLDVELPEQLCCTHEDCLSPLLIYQDEKLWTHNATCQGCGQTYSLKPLLKEQLEKDKKLKNQLN